jgi:hypothetical protein
MQQVDLNKLYFIARELDCLQRMRKGKPLSGKEYERRLLTGETEDLTVTIEHNKLEDIAERIRELTLAEEEKGGRR